MTHETPPQFFDHQGDPVDVPPCPMCGDTSVVTRVEVIDQTGRVFVVQDCTSVTAMLQDGGRTLKLFIETVTMNGK